jgi:hypothetical protein
MPDAADGTDEGAVAASVREVVLRDNPAVNALPAFIERAEVIEKILTHLGLSPAHSHRPPGSIAA